MILDNGVARTMDPSLPVTRALAIAGDPVADDCPSEAEMKDRKRVGYF